jgi:hypothetical protein
MNFLELAITIFILYLLYKLVYNVIVPVSKATSAVRNQMQEMQQEQMRNQQAYERQQSAGFNGAPRNRHDSTTTDGEYIDFEEVK